MLSDQQVRATLRDIDRQERSKTITTDEAQELRNKLGEKVRQDLQAERLIHRAVDATNEVTQFKNR